VIQYCLVPVVITVIVTVTLMMIVTFIIDIDTDDIVHLPLLIYYTLRFTIRYYDCRPTTLFTLIVVIPVVTF